MKMKFLAALVAALFVGAVSPALADNTCVGNANCSTTTNNLPGANPTFNTTTNTAAQQQGQAQGQLQGQQQGQIGIVAPKIDTSNSVGNGIGNFSPSAKVESDNRLTNTTNPVQNNNQTNSQRQSNDNVNVNKNVSVSESESTSAAIAANKNAQAVSLIQNTYNPNDITIRSAPAISIPGPASGPCNGASLTLGASVIGGGGGIGYSGVDQGCEERELARMLSLSGRNDLALDVLQNTDAYKRVQERKAAAAKKAEADKQEQLAAARAQETAAAEGKRNTAMRNGKPRAWYEPNPALFN